MHKNNHFLTSVRNAFNGIKIFILTEKNVKFHLLATILVILVASFLRLPLINWLFLALAISLVWIAELFNSSLEYLFDFVQPEIDPRVKMGKDMSAAAVLLSAIFSLIVGILILGPPIIQALLDTSG